MQNRSLYLPPFMVSTGLGSTGFRVIVLTRSNYDFEKCSYRVTTTSRMLSLARKKWKPLYEESNRSICLLV